MFPVSRRQQQVAKGIEAGMTVHQISQLLDISEQTVRGHRWLYMRRMKGHQRREPVKIPYTRTPGMLPQTVTFGEQP